jgi:hypothetical protein
MRTVDQSPAYVLQIKNRWRVAIPIRGKLTPLLCPQEFLSRARAEEWLQSHEGSDAVATKRARRSVRCPLSPAAQNTATAGSP